MLGFGTFEVRTRAAREGRNPATEESMTIPAAKVPSFKAGKGLKDAVNS
ncbi:MAG: HU family DNA-binding protein [Clostridia bacterium]|nr:HU family DNA-binding protein [Clostridia bacterium]